MLAVLPLLTHCVPWVGKLNGIPLQTCGDCLHGKASLMQLAVCAVQTLIPGCVVVSQIESLEMLQAPAPVLNVE